MSKIQLDSQIWRDDYYMSLAVDEQKLFIYFLTCPASNIFGIYQIPFPEIVGHNKNISEKRIKQIIQKFENNTKILYKEGWLCFKNRNKYNIQGNNSIDVGFNRCIKESPLFIKEFLEKHNIITPSPHGGSNYIEYNKIEYNKIELNIIWDEILKKWNNTTWRTKIRDISEERKEKFKTRCQCEDFIFDNIIKAADESGEFLKDSNWFSFDWIIKNNINYKKLLDGNYKDKGKQEPELTPATKAIHEKFLAKVKKVGP